MFTSTCEKRGVIRLDRDIIGGATQAGLSLFETVYHVRIFMHINL